MKILAEIAQNIAGARIIGDAGTMIEGIERDSRKVNKNILFACIEGQHFDGHDFIAAAISSGASAIMTNRTDVVVPSEIAVLLVEDIQGALARIVPFFYDYPSRDMRVIGITGTNGKTTTSYLARDIFRRAGKRTGLIGTIQIMVEDEIIPTENTTPDVVEMQKILAKMREKGVEVVIMEVSSHALDQNRVAGIEFDIAVFTNLTQDHLDYHQTLDNYAIAKARLFSLLATQNPSPLKANKRAVLNADDNSVTIMRNALGSVAEISYGLKGHKESQSLGLTAKDIKLSSSGMELSILGKALGESVLKVAIPMTGIFNVYNILGAVGVALANGVAASIIQAALNAFNGVSGRFELIRAGQRFAVAVDYAHTPDGMENVLRTAREVTKGRIIAVFGCGGDRDRTKRPIMGEMGARLADLAIITSDNPRTENPELILRDVEAGIINSSELKDKPYEKLVDRRQAIFRAIELAGDDDMVVIMGKGHEDYQIIGTHKIDFDDRKIAREAIREVLGYGKDYCLE